MPKLNTSMSGSVFPDNPLEVPHTVKNIGVLMKDPAAQTTGADVNVPVFKTISLQDSDFFLRNPCFRGEFVGQVTGDSVSSLDTNDVAWNLRYVYDDGTTPVVLATIAKTAFLNVNHSAAPATDVVQCMFWGRVLTPGASGKIQAAMKLSFPLTTLVAGTAYQLFGGGPIAGTAVDLTKSGYFDLCLAFSAAAVTTDNTKVNGIYGRMDFDNPLPGQNQ